MLIMLVLRNATACNAAQRKIKIEKNQNSAAAGRSTGLHIKVTLLSQIFHFSELYMAHRNTSLVATV